MCGIVGIAGPLLTADQNLMKRLLLFDYLRGNDSTGIAAVRNNGDVAIAKMAADPITFFDSKEFDKVCDGVKSKAFIGHNRYATRGGKNAFNAHPFQFDHISGVHNGTLDTLSWKALEKELDVEFNVDSQALIAAIAKLGIKKTIALCTEGKTSDTGAWSLVWYDSIENTLNFLRNKHRPMWLSYEKDFKRIFFASEWWMIDAAIRSQGGYELYAEGKEQFKYFPTDVDKHYKFDLGLLLQEQKKPKPKTCELKGKEPPVASGQGSFPIRHGNDSWTNVTGRTKEGNTASSKTSKKSTSSPGKTHLSNSINWLGTRSQPLCGYIKKERFEQLEGFGCSWCSGHIEFGDPGILIVERDEIILCADCVGNEVVTEETPTKIIVPAAEFEHLR